MTALLPKTAFIGLEHVAHLAAGGEAPVLRTHVDTATRFFLDKVAGMPGRERFAAVADLARERLAGLLGGRPAEVALLAHASEGLYVASEGVDWRPGDNVVVEQSEFPSVLEEGLAWLGAGRCRLALGREAGDELRRAREVLLELGARRPVEEADELLRRSMAQTS